MKYAAVLGSCATLYTSSFIETGSATQKFTGDSQTHRQHGDRISLLPFLTYFLK
jgi:hypothetical protein